MVESKANYSPQDSVVSNLSHKVYGLMEKTKRRKIFLWTKNKIPKLILNDFSKENINTAIISNSLSDQLNHKFYYVTWVTDV